MAPVKWEEIWEQQPLRDSWWTCPGGFLVYNLGSIQKRKGKRDIPGERCSLLQGKAAFWSIQVFRQPSWLVQFSVPEIQPPRPCSSRIFEVELLCSKQSCHKSKDLGLPEEQLDVVCSGLITLGQPQQSPASVWSRCPGPSVCMSGAGNHTRKAKTQQPRRTIAATLAHSPLNHPIKY